jgi:hypothetical protein
VRGPARLVAEHLVRRCRMGEASLAPLAVAEFSDALRLPLLDLLRCDPPACAALRLQDIREGQQLLYHQRVRMQQQRALNCLPLQTLWVCTSAGWRPSPHAEEVVPNQRDEHSLPHLSAYFQLDAQSFCTEIW